MPKSSGITGATSSSFARNKHQGTARQSASAKNKLHLAAQQKSQGKIFTLLEIACMIVVAGLVTGGAIFCKSFIETSHLVSQVTQIHQFDSAVATFYEKYNGLPGDLLSLQAKQFGLPAGDGTPAHSDGNGKISPCKPGLQINLGCETALFWSQLSITGLISNNFSADSRFTDDRLTHIGDMFPYLPQSPVSEDLYISVWNADIAQPASVSAMPNGNYYEITKISGVMNERLKDNAHALTPLQAYAIDQKMDDGLPTTGRVMANSGDINSSTEMWGSFAKTNDNTCVTPDRTYNINAKAKARIPLCHLAIAFNCCNAKEYE